MSDLTITPGSVVPGSNAKIEHGTAAATVTAGQTGYINSSGNVALFDSNAVAPANSLKGIILNGASTGQPCGIQTDGDITIGATVSKGAAYYGSATPGGICPFADLASGHSVCVVGVAKSTTELSLTIRNTGAVI